jgi:hypothetical protein
MRSTYLSRTAFEWPMMPDRDRRIEGEVYLDRETRLMDGPTREQERPRRLQRDDWTVDEANAA